MVCGDNGDIFLATGNFRAFFDFFTLLIGRLTLTEFGRDRSVDELASRIVAVSVVDDDEFGSIRRFCGSKYSGLMATRLCNADWVIFDDGDNIFFRISSRMFGGFILTRIRSAFFSIKTIKSIRIAIGITQ